MDQHDDHPGWPQELSSFWIDSAEVLSAEAAEEEKPGRDSLGNPGRVHVVKRQGRLGVRLPRGRVVSRLEETGLRSIRITAEETELNEPRKAERSEEIDPFLLEKSVVVTVRGRDFPGDQRAIIEAKVEKLRREFGDASTPQARRDAAGKMLSDLEEGLKSTLDVRSVVRRFRPTVAVKDPVETMGTVLPLRAGCRIVYRVAPATPEKGDEADEEPMVFHLVGLGRREVVLLYTGGVHGQRHLRDLEESFVHHAWFANRERVKTEATAPWIGRKVFRDIATNGVGAAVIHKRRDLLPVSIEKIGEETFTIQAGGRPVEVPVLRCRSGRDDEMLILDDPESPLVLRLYETGAEIVRTIDAVLSPQEEAVVA